MGQYSPYVPGSVNSAELIENKHAEAYDYALDIILDRENLVTSWKLLCVLGRFVYDRFASAFDFCPTLEVHLLDVFFLACYFIYKSIYIYLSILS